MQASFDIYITGSFTEGTDPQKAINALAKAARLEPGQAQQLFDSAPSIIKRGVDEATAKSYQQKLLSIGIVTEIRQTIEQPSTPATPTEKHEQVKDAQQRRLIPFLFSGQGYEYFKIWIVNILLTIVTLGIYAPWAKVRNTQYFYGNTTLDGASFAFTADPVKMLIGRLIALGLLIVYMVVSALAPLFTALFSLAFIFILPWVMVRSLAFYARNTQYRNIRFRFTGDYWGAFKVTILWPIAGLLTIGLLMPLAIKKQQEYTINNHSYGNKSFNFSAGTGEFYRIFLAVIVIFIIGGVISAVLVGFVPQIAPFAMLVAYAVVIIYSMVQMQNLVMNNVNLAEHNFVSNYQFGSFALVMLKNFLLLILTLGLYYPWARVNLARYGADHTQLNALGDLDKFAAVSQPDPSAFGEEFGDVFDMEVGF